MNIRIVKNDGVIENLCPEIITEKGKTKVFLSKEKIPSDALYIDFLYDYFTANTGDKGYFVLPFDCQKGVCATYFNEKNDTEYVSDFSQISCYGYKKEKGGIFGIITGLKEYYTVVAGVKDGVYYAYPRFLIEGFAPQEDISVGYYDFEKVLKI